MRAKQQKAVIVLSGGMDSTTLAYLMQRKFGSVRALTFNYGQRHHREVDAARAVARTLGMEHTTISLQAAMPPLQSALLPGAGIDVPQGHYHEETMRQTVVPGRNVLMLTVAFMWACADGASVVGMGIHAGDHFIYPDCRPRFARAYTRMIQLALSDQKVMPRLFTPFLNFSKTDILRKGQALHVDYAQTYTCYQGGAQPCGACGACTERAEAFREVGVTDPLLQLQAVPVS